MKQENIDRILDLGVQILMRKSYHQLGLKELLDEAGIPKGSFYYYFDSKEDFGQKVIIHYAEQSAEAMKKVLLNQKKSPRERLELLFENQRKVYLKSNCTEGCLMGDSCNELAGQFPGFQKVLDEKFEGWQDILKACIAEGQDIGEFRKELPAEDLASFILNSWEGALVRMKASRLIKPFTLFMDYTFQLILKA